MTMTKEEAQKAYDDLIAYRQQNILIKSKEHPGRVEIHHIIPISIGGSNNNLNKISLLAKEHFMAHVYLWIIHHDDEFHDQMTAALMNMHNGTIHGSRKEIREFILMSKDYQQAREEFGKIASILLSKVNKGKKNSNYGKHWIRNPQTKESKLISSNEVLPIGWEYGNYKNITNKVKAQLKKFSQSSKGKMQIYNPITKERKHISKNDQIPEGFEKRGRPLKEQDKQKIKNFYKKNNEENIAPKRRLELRPMYAYYIENGWKKFKEHFNYQYSQPNFVGLCKRYLPEFKSNQGKQIGKSTMNGMQAIEARESSYAKDESQTVSNGKSIDSIEPVNSDAVSNLAIATYVLLFIASIALIVYLCTK